MTDEERFKRANRDFMWFLFGVLFGLFCAMLVYESKRWIP